MRKTPMKQLTQCPAQRYVEKLNALRGGTPTRLLIDFPARRYVLHKNKHTEKLSKEVSEIIELIYMQLHLVKIDEVRTMVLETMRALAHHHQDKVLNSLLMKPLPFDKDTSDLWRSLTDEPSYSCKVLRFLMVIINEENELTLRNSLSFTDDQPAAALMPLKATCAIHEVLQAASSHAAIQELVPALFCTLLAEVSQTLGRRVETATFSSRRRRFRRATTLGDLNPCSLAVDALQCLLSFGNTQMASVKGSDETEGWTLIKNIERHHEGVMQITRGLIVSKGELIKDVVHCLLPSLSSDSTTWRVTGTAVFVELMGHRILRGLKLLKKLVKDMKRKSLDPNYAIRSMAIRALGSVSYGAPDKSESSWADGILQRSVRVVI
ncbi:maestro heat-like repeat-containing protein family member 2B [Ambystoma mexicanum]|uniref:maestro heat-like repeat-containing protein family member 2B n=1 Tax=Ambystoma mexicanum TaxID=8296 RepID=UPI0037E84437